MKFADSPRIISGLRTYLHCLSASLSRAFLLVLYRLLFRCHALSHIITRYHTCSLSLSFPFASVTFKLKLKNVFCVTVKCTKKAQLNNLRAPTYYRESNNFKPELESQVNTVRDNLFLAFPCAYLRVKQFTLN